MNSTTTMQEREQHRDPPSSDMEDCLSSIRIARAVDLARCGHFLEAESVLAVAGQLPGKADELDLLARIAILQQDFCKAERLWKRAIELSPNDEALHEAHEAAKQGRLIQIRRIMQLRIAGAILLLLLAVVFAVAIILSAIGSKGQADRMPDETSVQGDPSAASK